MLINHFPALKKFLLVLCLFVFFSPVRFQANYALKPPDARTAVQSLSNPGGPTNCEDVLLYLDEAVNKVREASETYLIVIARPGRREKAGRINRMRLNSIGKYLGKFSDIKYVTAEGEHTKGLGQIEIYVSGRRLRVLLVKENAKYLCEEPIG